MLKPRPNPEKIMKAILMGILRTKGGIIFASGPIFVNVDRRGRDSKGFAQNVEPWNTVNMTWKA
jgi:hypothetical protein